MLKRTDEQQRTTHFRALIGSLSQPFFLGANLFVVQFNLQIWIGHVDFFHTCWLLYDFVAPLCCTIGVVRRVDFYLFCPLHHRNHYFAYLNVFSTSKCNLQDRKTIFDTLCTTIL